MPKFVAYFRVSTTKQGIAGLGMEAQRAAVMAYLGDQDPLASYIEVESGRRADRPELRRALDHCRRDRATLTVAKLDRLARNVAFISSLMESGVDFVAVDFPQANRLTLHLLAAVAEHEREMTSTRTKAALAAARARGVRLGGPQFTTPEGAREQSRLANAAWCTEADGRAAALRATVERVMATGIQSYKELAEVLNARGVRTPRGRSWHGSTARLLLLRLARLARLAAG